MKERIVMFTVLLLLSSCAKELIKDDTKNVISPNSDWAIIEKIESERWTKNNLVTRLGVPDEIFDHKKEIPGFLVYNYAQSNHQKWGFEIDKNEKITTITFIPSVSNNENFTLAQIIQKWGAICTKKKEVDSSQHFVRNIYYLDCGKNHRAYLNRYDEVTSLAISVD